VLWFDASLFAERRAIGYIWDSSAPVGTVIRQSSGAAERALVVVRSGPSGLGAWHRDKRDAYQDYRDIFGDEPAQLVAVTLESHSDDLASESASCSVEFDSRSDRLQGERTNAIQGSGRSYEGAASTHRPGEAEDRVPRLALAEPALRAPRPECGATARRRANICL
jgi:Protein of unknown function (DUF3047)